MMYVSFRWSFVIIVVIFFTCNQSRTWIGESNRNVLFTKRRVIHRVVWVQGYDLVLNIFLLKSFVCYCTRYTLLKKPLLINVWKEENKKCWTCKIQFRQLCNIFSMCVYIEDLFKSNYICASHKLHVYSHVYTFNFLPDHGHFTLYSSHILG